MNVINLKSKEMRMGLIVLNDYLGEGAGTFCYLSPCREYRSHVP